MGEVEVKTPEFTRQISLEYEEFDVKAFFEELMPFVRTPHRCYHIEGEETLEILIGITHPVMFRVKTDKKTLKELEQKLRLYGFRKASWEWR
jgi:hypothetical protein